MNDLVNPEQQIPITLSATQNAHLHPNACVFLDRDGVLNRERGTYTHRAEDLEVLPGVPEALRILKEKGFLLVVITNQGGIDKGIYTKEDVENCHRLIQEACGHLIDDIFYSPYHPAVSECLGRKPETLMFERAISRYKINPAKSWMVGDHERDMIPAIALGMGAVLIEGQAHESSATHRFPSLLEAVLSLF